MLNKIILGVAICLSGVTLSYAQEIEKPGPEHARLAKELVGTWDGVMDMDGQKSKCTATYKSICDGMWLASDFEGELGGAKYHGHGLDGYDLNKKKYVGVWIDSLSSGPMNMEGDYDPKSKLLVMTGESTGPDGKAYEFRTTTETKDKGHFTFKFHIVQPDGTDQLAFTIEYARRK